MEHAVICSLHEVYGGCDRSDNGSSVLAGIADVRGCTWIMPASHEHISRIPMQETSIRGIDVSLAGSEYQIKKLSHPVQFHLRAWRVITVLLLALAEQAKLGDTGGRAGGEGRLAASLGLGIIFQSGSHQKPTVMLVLQWGYRSNRAAGVR